MDRRTFLKRGLAGGAVLLLGSGTLAVLPTKELASAKRALAVLEPRSFQVIVAIARRVCPPTADVVEVAHGVDDLLRGTPVEVQSDFNKLLALFENALPGFLFDQRFLPFTRLSGDAQDAVLRDWRDSRLEIRRTGYHALRKACLATAYAQDAQWPAIGYAPLSGTELAKTAYDDSKAGAT